MHSKKHCWHAPVTDVVTLKWNIPLYSSKDWSRGTTCTIRLLLNVSEEIAAKNQQLPVIRCEATLIFKQHLMAFGYFWSGHDLPTAPWAKSNREAPLLQKTGSSSLFWACRISWTVEKKTPMTMSQMSLRMVWTVSLCYVSYDRVCCELGPQK